MSDEKCVSERECDTRHDGLNCWVTKIDGRVGKLETMFWSIVTLLIGNLIGVIVLILKG